VIRRLLLLVAGCCCTGIARAQPTAELALSADQTTYAEATDETIMTGKVEMREADLLVTGDELRYKGHEGTSNAAVITAIGHVVYTRGPVRILADKVVVHRADGTFSAEHLRIGSYPYFVAGKSASGTRNEITVFDARVTFGEPGPWQPTATATKVIVVPGQRLRFEGAQVGIGHAQPVPFPQFQQSLAAEPMLSFVTLTGGYRGSLGAFADAGVHLPLAPGVRAGGDVGYYTARGVLVGPSGTYVNPSNPDQLHGSFRSGYINDHGDKGVDVLGRPIPEQRAFVEWDHRQTIGDAFTLTGQLNWWRDSEVVRDFRPRLFFPVQQPDSFAEATYTNANSFISAFARFAPNSFEFVQQRAPEIRFDLLPLAVGGGIYERFNASIAMLHERTVAPSVGSTVQLPVPIVGPIILDPLGAMPASPAVAPTVFTDSSVFPDGTRQDLRSTRMDAYYGLSRPIAYRDWVTLTPVAGGRVTHYMNTTGATRDGAYTRVLGEVGADAELHASGTFAYKNEAWHIDGLRHLFTPRLSYRYIPEADAGRAHIPAIDRQTFSTYLQPLGLGDVRAIDELRATNTLRLSLDNTLQTRDPQYGARDLLTLNVADDFRFKRQPGERDVSEIHTELAAMPARWLEVGLYNSFSPQNFTLREFNTGVTIHDGTAWTVRFSNNFLQHQLEDYFVDSRFRVNEQFDALARLRYDQRKHRFDEQAYGLVQNLANTWRISYVVSLYSGPRRESHFGFSVQIDTVRF
jgi:LPS-assembly protein